MLPWRARYFRAELLVVIVVPLIFYCKKKSKQLQGGGTTRTAVKGFSPLLYQQNEFPL